MSNSRPTTILVVDDNPATRYSTCRFLRAAGFTTDEAGTGMEALARAQNGPDVVVLDVNLPDIDGFEVCRRLRATESTSRIPIIHLSATFASDTDKVHGLDAGADGYLTHPVEPPVLVATVNAFLRTRSAEEGMRRSEEKFRAIFDQAINGITLISRELLFIEVNPAMCCMLDRARDYIVGKHLSGFVSTESEDAIATVVDNLEACGQWRGTLSHLRADGKIIELDWSISTHSSPGMRLAIVTDITERRAHEAERERLLQSERAARADAERANRVKDEFLATLSHELRTPLNAIVGWSQILKQGNVTADDYQEGLEAIERNAKTQADLISDLLDVSRITSGKMRLDMQPIDPLALVRTAMEGVIPSAIEKGIVIDQDLDPTVGTIIADPSRLQQVIWNLVNNAVKFTPPGGEITVKLRTVGTETEICVLDNGQGISADFLPHMFDRFRQEDGTTRRNHGGLGLGLAIVKHLVELHGGRIYAASEGEGKGSVFTVRLPLVHLPIEPTEPSVEKQQTQTQHPPRGRTVLDGVRILIVDDDTDARTLVRRVLGEYAATVFDAASAADALALLDQFKPQILISDIGMPQQDGYDLIRQVRSRYAADLLPAIALTAFARPEDFARSLHSGFQAHLAKPVNTNQLIATIAALLGRVELPARS